MMLPTNLKFEAAAELLARCGWDPNKALALFIDSKVRTHFCISTLTLTHEKITCTHYHAHMCVRGAFGARWMKALAAFIDWLKGMHILAFPSILKWHASTLTFTFLHTLSHAVSTSTCTKVPMRN